MPAGYSGTPLQKKLGIKPGFTLLLLQQPDHYFELLGDLPDDCTILESADPEPAVDEDWSGLKFVYRLKDH